MLCTQHIFRPFPGFLGISDRRTSKNEHIVEFMNSARASVAIAALDNYIFDAMVEQSPRLRLILL